MAQISLLRNRLDWLRQLEAQDHLLGAPWLAVATMIGVGRFIEEALMIYLPRGGSLSFGAVVNSVTFYAHVIWIYTAAAAILARLPWRRTLGPAMAATGIGMLPPLVDTVVYGVGRFNYLYQLDFLRATSGLVRIDLARGIPFAEALAAYASMGLLATYAGVRARSLGRVALALVAGYGLMYLWGSGLPSLVGRLSRVIGLSLLVTVSLAQVLTVIAIYYGLNPSLLQQAVRRLPHALPAPLLVLLGGAMAHQPVGPTVAVALLAGVVTVFAVHQNDFYDRSEDQVSGRTSVVLQEDVHFFLAALILMLAVLVVYQVAVAVCIMAFYLLTLLYHHPRFRSKRIFPLSYLLEGACAAMMVSAGILSTGVSPAPWTAWLGPVVGFLAFTLGSPFKDYKDVDGDQAAGNETVYTLARTRAWPIRSVHLAVTLTLTALIAAPTFWLRWLGVPAGLGVVLGVGAWVSVPLALLGIEDRKRATETALWLVNAYLLTYALLAWQS